MLTDAKAGITIETVDCDNPVASHYSMGEQIGISGTPAIIVESGQILPGYVPADKLIKLLSSVTKL